MKQAPKPRRTIREAVGIFDDDVSLEAAMDELRSNGFDRHELSVLASGEVVVRKLGHHYRRVETLADNPKTPRTFFVPAESIDEAKGALISFPLFVVAIAATGMMFASGGTMFATIIAAASGGAGGAMLGGILATMLAKHHTQYLQEQIERGGLLLWAHTRNAEYEKKAAHILQKNGAHNVHVHDIRVDYRRQVA